MAKQKKKKLPPAQTRIACPKCGKPRPRRASGVQVIEGRAATVAFECDTCRTLFRSLEVRLPVKPPGPVKKAISALLTSAAKAEKIFLE